MKRLKINFYGELLRLGKWIGKENTIAFTENEVNDQIAELTTKERKVNTAILAEGLMNTYQNRIEIWFIGRKIHNTKIAELASDGLLFPLFDMQQDSLEIEQSQSEIYLEHREVGLISSYEVMLNTFQPSFLRFKIVSLRYQGKDILLLTGLSYKNINLKSIRNDCMVIRNYYYRV